MTIYFELFKKLDPIKSPVSKFIRNKLKMIRFKSVSIVHSGNIWERCAIYDVLNHKYYHMRNTNFHFLPCEYLDLMID